MVITGLLQQGYRKLAYEIARNHYDNVLKAVSYTHLLMDVQVLKNGNPEGGVKIHYSRIQLDEPLKLDFSVPSKYKRITFAQVLKTITNLNQ